jgi:hypothetical protein
MIVAKESKQFSLPVNYLDLAQWERRSVREQYAREQDGKCSHCKELLTGPASKEMLGKKINERLFPQHFFKYPVHLHHSHETGMTIGAVHNYCNAVLWQYHGE